MKVLFCRETVKFYKKLTSIAILVSFVSSLLVVPSSAQILPVINSPISISTAYAPPVLLGLKIHPENPLLLDFIVDQGQAKLSTQELKNETEKLVKYFLAALTIPDQEVWVNLSPYEKDRIIPDVLGQTTMGKTMLEQDYLLKQLAASLTNPETDLGKNYWDQVHEAETLDVGRLTLEKTTNVHPPATSDQRLATNNLNKVWIMPESAEVLESNGIVLVGEKRLKVMLADDVEKSTVIARSTQGDAAILEQTLDARRSLLEKQDARRWTLDVGENKNKSTTSDQLPATTDQSPTPSPQSLTPSHQPPATSVSTHIFRSTILPVIDKAVNEGNTFADVRQIYNSVILAAWYKKALKESLLGKVYTDKGKVAGVETDDKEMKQRIYEQYLAAFKKGAYSLIKEEADENGDLIPRKYFSGGEALDVNNVLVQKRGAHREVEETLLASSTIHDAFVQFGESQTPERIIAPAAQHQSAASAVTNLQTHIAQIKRIRVYGAFVALMHGRNLHHNFEYLNDQLSRWEIKPNQREEFISFLGTLSNSFDTHFIPQEFINAHARYADIYSNLAMMVMPVNDDLRSAQSHAVDAALESLSDEHFKEFLSLFDLEATRNFFSVMAKNDEKLFPTHRLDEFLNFALKKAQLAETSLQINSNEVSDQIISDENIEPEASLAADKLFTKLVKLEELNLKAKDNDARAVLQAVVYDMALRLWSEADITVKQVINTQLDSSTIQGIKPNAKVTDEQMQDILSRLDLKNGRPGKIISPLLEQTLNPFVASSALDKERSALVGKPLTIVSQIVQALQNDLLRPNDEVEIAYKHYNGGQTVVVNNPKSVINKIVASTLPRKTGQFEYQKRIDGNTLLYIQNRGILVSNIVSVTLKTLAASSTVTERSIQFATELTTAIRRNEAAAEFEKYKIFFDHDGNRDVNYRRYFTEENLLARPSLARAFQEVSNLHVDRDDLFENEEGQLDEILRIVKSNLALNTKFNNQGDIIGLHGVPAVETFQAIETTLTSGLIPELKGPEEVRAVREKFKDVLLAQTVAPGELVSAVEASADILISSEMLFKDEIIAARIKARERNKSITIIAGVDPTQTDAFQQVRHALDRGADGVKLKPAGKGNEVRTIALIEQIKTAYSDTSILVAGGVTEANRESFGFSVKAGMGPDSLEEIRSVVQWAQKSDDAQNPSASSAIGMNNEVASAPNTLPVGGIDFDPTNMNLQIKRNGKGVPLPLPQQDLEHINIQGLFPIIINIVPINAQNLPILLGQAPKEPAKEPDLAFQSAG